MVDLAWILIIKEFASVIHLVILGLGVCAIAHGNSLLDSGEKLVCHLKKDRNCAFLEVQV